MVLGMMSVAFASGSATGGTETYKITIDNTDNTTVSIVGKAYSAYKLFDVTYSGSDAEDPHAYTIDTNTNGDGAWAWNTLIAGVTADTSGVYDVTKYGLKFIPTAADPKVYHRPGPFYYL